MTISSGQSGPKKTWAYRVVEALLASGDLELEEGVEPAEVEPAVSDLLDKYGEKPLYRREAVEDLADALAEVVGVDDLYVTANDLQTILRRTLDPPS